MPVGRPGGPHRPRPRGETMLTTTVDGLWILQVLCGIEVLAAELGLRPHLPRVETAELALAHPAADELRRCGAITDSGEVDEPVREWLTVLARREVAVLVHSGNPLQDRKMPGDRILIARFAQWWVVVERCADIVRLSAAGRAHDELSAARLVNAQIDRLCGQLPAAEMRPLTVDAEALLAEVRDEVSLSRYLVRQGFDPGQVGALTAAADPARSTQSAIVAIQSGVPNARARTHVDPGAVTIIDSAHGRLLSEQVTRSGKPWMVVGPGSPAAIASAVRSMLRRLPAQDEWFSYRKVV